MSTKRIPLATLSLLLIVTGLHLLPADRTPLYFSAADIARGEAWRLLTGHFMHADLEHLLWNGVGLAILGWLIERRSAALLWTSLAAGIAAVDILLLSPLTQLQYYCGLSGILNSLLVVALWLEWRTSRSWQVATVAAGCVLKVVVEIALGVSVFTDIGWPPFAWSHAAGLLGGLLVLCTCRPGLARVPNFAREWSIILFRCVLHGGLSAPEMVGKAARHDTFETVKTED